MSLLAFVIVVGLAVRAGAITYGTVDKVHTYVGAMIIRLPEDFPNEFGWCSGSLVSPRVFLTAGHCLDFLNSFGIRPNDVFISFAVRILEDPKSWRAVSGFTLHPAFAGFLGGADSHDVGVVILEKPVRNIAPGKLSAVGLLDDLAASGALRDATFTTVGYGRDENLQITAERRMATSGFYSLLDAWLYHSENPATGDGGGCFQDSGAPKLFNDGTSELIVALESWGDSQCRSLDVGYRVDTLGAQDFIMAAIQANP